MSQGSHERIARKDDTKSSSDRSFGFIFMVVFLVIGLWPLLDAEAPRYWSIAIAAVFLGAALVVPSLLAPLNRLWTKFGAVLHKIMNPVILGLMFLVAVTPVALIMRALGKDPLNRAFANDATSYWIDRPERGPTPESMRDQF